MFGIIAQSRSDMADGEIHASFKIDKRSSAPNRFHDFSTGDDLSGTTYKQGKQFGWLRLKAHHDTRSSQLSRSEIKVKVSKSSDFLGIR